MNKCERCGLLHYRTDPCRAAKNKPETANSSGAAVAGAAAPRFGLASPANALGAETANTKDAPKPKRGRPISDTPKSPRAEYQRELMRDHRNGIYRRAKPKEALK